MEQLSVMSVLVDEDEFLDLKSKEDIDLFPVVYIKMNDGTLRMRRKVKGGQYMVLPIKHLPNQKPGQTTTVTTTTSAELKARKAMLDVNANILPSGKIPLEVLHQIISFFMSVMNNKIKSVIGTTNYTTSTFRHEYEAMAHIIWNEHTKQYRIGIPTQRVSKASVSYDHDDYDAAAGDMVIVDIHSHNTMSAFFSSTDDTDDKKFYCYTGVIGNLDKPTPTMKFRLNAGEVKVEMDIDDIFDFSLKLPDIPQDWTDKVTVQSYSSGYGAYHYPRGGRPTATPGTPEWFRQMDDFYDDDGDVYSFGGGANGNRGGGGKNRQGRFPTSRQGNATVSGETDDVLTRFISTGQLPKEIQDQVNAGSLDLESFLDGFVGDSGGLSEADQREIEEFLDGATGGGQTNLADLFDPQKIHDHGDAFTRLIKGYLGYKEINSDSYVTLKTLQIYEDLEKLASDWDAIAAPAGFLLSNTNTGITVTAVEFITDLSPLAVYFQDMQDAEALDVADEEKFAQDAWELIHDINQGTIY